MTSEVSETSEVFSKSRHTGFSPVTMDDAIKKSSAYIPMGRFGRPEETAQTANPLRVVFQ